MLNATIKKGISLILAVVFISISCIAPAYAQTTEPSSTVASEEKIYSDATMEDEFDGSSILVTMDKNFGGPGKKAQGGGFTW